MPAPNIAVKTRSEMESEHGAAPARHVTRWTIHRAHASITYVTDDGGNHWAKRDVVHASVRARRSLESLAREES